MSDLTNKSSSESENERRLRVRQEFLKLDKDRSGYLEVNELKQWLLGYTTTLVAKKSTGPKLGMIMAEK